MTDLEVVRKCAEKMGIPLTVQPISEAFVAPVLDYDPLHDDAQCMDLIKAFPDETLEALTFMVDRHPRGTLPPDDLFNRTVCETVARMP